MAVNLLNIFKKNCQGQNLIFLISQPRAGSTMTQKILGNHKRIHTVSEPWILLPNLYPLRHDNFEAEYNSKLGKIGWSSFFKELPEEEETYYEGLRLMYSHIYGSALKGTGKKFFLDKTPRYYFIIPEIYRTFPQAKFIILLRNPLAVICSIITTWVKNEWSGLEVLKYDLIRGPNLLLEGIDKLGDSCLVVYYEEIINNPVKEFNKICQSIGIKFYPEMIEYGVDNSIKWRFGDKGLVYEKSQPDPENLDKWILSLKNPQIWQTASDYLEFLGEEIVFQMGYSYKELRETLDINRPQEFDFSQVSRVEWLQKNKHE